MARKIKTMDANTAAAWVSYAFSETAAVYPITPSSKMAELADQWAKEGRKNIFGHPLSVVRMQSEAGVAGFLHGALVTGALSTTFTASQGLLLMIPDMYKISGELLPAVIHVSARSISTHALSIFGDHSDVLSCRQTGFAFLCACNAQEVMDFAAVAHLSAISSSVPFLHFFDGFRTSHEISKVSVWDYDELREMADFGAIRTFRMRALNPWHPKISGTAQNPDIFFQNREAANLNYFNLPHIVKKYFGEVNKRTGSDYDLVNYYGVSDAEKVIVAMGSVCETIEETVDYLIKKGEKVGLLKIRLYRPFPSEDLRNAIPKTTKKIAVLDRTKEPGAIGEPLYLDVVAAFSEQEKRPLIVGGRYGLSSKDTLPSDILAVYKNLDEEKPKNGFTLAINDDVTHLSLERAENIEEDNGAYSCKLWGIGSDGTVGAAKSTVQIVGDNTKLFVQGYFSYDSKKSGGITVAHLRFSEKKIKSAYEIEKADFIGCYSSSYIEKYDITKDIKNGGKILLNCSWSDEELDEKLPRKMKKRIVEQNVELYTINADKIAEELGIPGKTSVILQSAFFALSKMLEFSEAKAYIAKSVKEKFSAKGEDIVNKNLSAIDNGAEKLHIVKIPNEWNDIENEEKANTENEEHTEGGFLETVFRNVNSLEGNLLPVSAFTSMADGCIPSGTTKYEKRAIASYVPVWDEKKCIMCGRCSAICPHASIRGFLFDEDELKCAPDGIKTKKSADGKYDFAVLVSDMDCTGCKCCVNACPDKVSALSLAPLEEKISEQRYFDYAVEKVSEKHEMTSGENVKGLQFRRPLLEFSGACAGCGETPYAKIVTQLCGDRAYIANATGCSSIWGASSPYAPYTVNDNGHGPAWASSLFEDNAEFGLGMVCAVKRIRENLKSEISEISDVKAEYDEWISSYDEGESNAIAAKKLIAALENSKFDMAEKVLSEKEYLSKKEFWIFGGDGWAYDIGFGGLDHMLSSGENVNILVFDTEVYSNTGGQASKATPKGAVAYFETDGKVRGKKRLSDIAVSYGDVYVAEVSLGYDMNLTIKAFSEAMSYKGVSLIIAYAPCISHGIRGGLSDTASVMKRAVDSGYINVYRYDPRRKENGENPFIFDAKMPTVPYEDFVKNEARFYSLFIKDEKRAEELLAEAKRDANERAEALRRK